MNNKHLKRAYWSPLWGCLFWFISTFNSATANNELALQQSQLYVFATDVRSPYAYDIVNHLTLMLITEGLSVTKNFKVVERAIRGAQISLELRSDETVIGAVPLNDKRQLTREDPSEIAKKLLSAVKQSGFLISASPL